MKQRIPRIKGLTLADKSDKAHIQRMILLHYINNNYTLNNDYYNVQQIADYLQIPVSSAMKEISRLMEVAKRQIGNMFKTDNGDSAIFQAQNFIWEAIHNSRKQLSTLAYRQGDEYVPFLSKEVNQAVANFNTAVKTALDLTKIMVPQKPTVQVLNQNNMAQVSHTYLGPDEALKLTEATMAKQASLALGSEGHLLLLEASNSLNDGLPDITSNAQNESAIMAKLMRKQGREDSGDISVDEERKFRDFRTLDEDNEDEVQLPHGVKKDKDGNTIIGLD